MRRKIIAGNWKMHKNIVEARALAGDLHKLIGKMTDPVVIICPPFTALTETAMVLKDSEILLGAQNMHEADQGAFTGEISADMLLTCGCSHVILGHSERRTLFSETDEMVNTRVKKALEAGLTPIVCVGETLEQREAGMTRKVIEGQINGSLKSLSESELEKTIIAYEPIWAIGTGKTATPEQAEDAHRFIRELLSGIYSRTVADNVSILYGGSVKSSNAEGLFARDNIDGALVGGASLKAEEFEAIAQAMP